MKANLIFILILSFSQNLFAGTPQWYKPGDTLYVFTQSGLILREKPGTDAKSIVKVPYGSKVVVMGSSVPPVSAVIDNIKGRWLYVDYYTVKGYVFDGYLSRLCPPEEPFIETVYPLMLYDYLNFYLETDGETINNSEENGGLRWDMEAQKWKGGIEAEYTINSKYTENYSDVKYHAVYTFGEGYRIEEVFQLMKLTGYFQKDLSLTYPPSDGKNYKNNSGFEFDIKPSMIVMRTDRITMTLFEDGASVKLVIDTESYEEEYSEHY